MVDPAASLPPEPPVRPELEALLAECLERAEAEGNGAIEQICAEHPELARPLRARLHALQRLGLFAPADDEEPPPRARLGEFTLLRRLGAGGMGVVWLARQESLGREVAVKVLPPAWSSSREAQQRFQREAHAVARLRHPNIVQVLSSGVDEGVAWIAFELVPGEGLDEILRRCARGEMAVPVARFLQWARDVARALECAHRAGIVHRDVKPANVRIVPDGRALLLDFGLARDAQSAALTLTGAFQGSPHYAAPEQVRAGSALIDARADVYSLGITLYECLAGRMPFEGKTTEQLFLQVLTTEPPPLRKIAPHVSRDLATVVTKAIEKLPDQRYASAGELGDDLEALLALEPIQARPPSWLRRASRWASEHRVRATLVVLTALGLIALPIVSVLQRQSAARDRQREARAEQALASAKLAELRQLGGDMNGGELEVLNLSQHMMSRPLTPDEYRRLDTTEDDVAALRVRRERLQHEILDSLRRAQRLDPELAGLDAVEVDLNHELWREAEHLWRNTLDRGARARAEASANFYRRRVDEMDTDRRHRTAMLGGVELVTEPPGAETWWFRLRGLGDVVPGGEPRIVPVPVLRHGEAPPVAPGSLALRVVRDCGTLASLDLIVALRDQPIGEPFGAARELAERGGIPATVCRNGELLKLDLPAGAELRTTAAPLVPCPACALGATPLVVEGLEQDRYVVLLRRRGFLDQRVVVDVLAGELRQLRIQLYPDKAAPPEFVPVVDADHRTLVMDREVTSAEYLLFLNEPATLAAIAASKDPIRFPRNTLNDRSDGFWARATRTGRFQIPDSWDPQWPILGVSWDDAVAYAAWKTERLRAENYDLRVSLPMLDEWQWFCGSTTYHVFGNRFRARWVSSCYGRSHPGPSPVQSHPVDESPHGLFDLSGSAFEWLDGWFWQGDGQRPLGAGSWAMARPEDFQAGSSIGSRPEGTWNTYGFRLIAR